jgi:hypothetical protein
MEVECAVRVVVGVVLVEAVAWEEPKGHVWNGNVE